MSLQNIFSSIIDFIIRNPSVVIFYTAIILLIIKYKDKFDIQAKFIALYRTKLGLKAMDKIASKHPRLLTFLGTLGIYIGFVGMLVISVFLIYNMFELILIPGAQSAIAPVLPGIRIPKSPVFVPFWYGIPAIFIVATIHEFSHGMIARLHKLKVKASGIVFFGPIIGAFVEPDERQLRRSSNKQQLSVFAAGPFSNILTALAVIFIISPLLAIPLEGAVIPTDVTILDAAPDFPAKLAGVGKDEIIQTINGINIISTENITSALNTVNPGEAITLVTDKDSYEITTVSDPENETKSYLGIGLQQNIGIHPSAEQKFTKPVIWTFFHLFQFSQWLFILSIGIGLANLLPLGPVDGGRMIKIFYDRLFKNKEKSYNVWKYTSLIFLFVLLFDLFFPYIRPLFSTLGL
ncbi:site-2 protease family protein [Candidatus Woesearchaeota archaeon]|nr:site-2 protease family protein [Candidatus Woesearchaeota archaeon]